MAFKDEVSWSVHEGGACHHVASSFGSGVFSFSSAQLSPWRCVFALWEKVQKHTECVSTVNADHNTIYWLRHNGQIAPGGSTAVETHSHVYKASIQKDLDVLSAIQDLCSGMKIYV